MAMKEHSSTSAADITIFKLSKPILTHDGEISELSLKPPTARAFVRHGAVYSVTKDGMLDIHYKALIGFVSEMSGHDALILESIPGQDMAPLANAVIEKLLGANPTSG